MAGEGPSASEDPDASRFHDRETEQIPRARPDRGPDDSSELDDPTIISSAPDYGQMTDPGAGRFVGSASAPSYYTVDEAPPRFSEDEFAGLTGDPGPAVYSTRRVLPLEDEPSQMVARYLFPTEKFRGEWKRHPVQLAKELAIAVFATILMGYVAGLLGKYQRGELMTVVILVWAVIMVYVIWKIADWYHDRFILTNKRVMVVNGLITRNVGMMPLLRVTDMKYVQSPMGRLLNYGNFELESAGQDQALSKIKNLPNPNELYLRIVEEMYEPEAVEARLGRAAEGDGGDGT
jgi:membrane protein YdbS with pleckstrin-like domain